jgi:hypothetical protein
MPAAALILYIDGSILKFLALALVLAALSSCMGRGAVGLVASFSSWRPQSRAAGSIESGLLGGPCTPGAMQGLFNAAASKMSDIIRSPLEIYEAMAYLYQLSPIGYYPYGLY